MREIGAKAIEVLGVMVLTYVLGTQALRLSHYVQNRVNQKIAADQKAAHHQGRMDRNLERIANAVEESNDLRKAELARASLRDDRSDRQTRRPAELGDQLEFKHRDPDDSSFKNIILQSGIDAFGKPRRFIPLNWPEIEVIDRPLTLPDGYPPKIRRGGLTIERPNLE